MTEGVDTHCALVSVVIPAYNCAPFIEQTIASLADQTEQQWECVIVDDGSTDETLIVAHAATAGDPRFTVLTQPNSGASAARNRGYRASSPDVPWVTFMDGDDVWRRDALKRLLDCCRTRSDIGCHGLAELIDAQGEPIQPGSYASRGRDRLALQRRELRSLPADRPTDFNVLINGNVLFPPGLVLARRSAYDAVGPFDEQLHGAEDWDMLIRLSRLGSLAFIDEVLLDYRRHDNNLGAKPTVAQQAWLVRCINFWSPENSVLQRRQARRGWRAYQRLLRAEALERTGAAIHGRKVRTMTRWMIQILVCTAREWRSCPLPRVVRPPLRW